MELCDEYLHEYIQLYPPLNDSIHIDQYIHLRGILPDIYSDTFTKQETKLAKRYEKRLSKKEKNNWDTLFEYDLKRMDTQFDYDLLPFDLNDNLYVYYIGLSKGTLDYIFLDTRSYDDFIKRLSQFPKLTTSLISKLKKRSVR